MRTEDALREALQREAAGHRVNPALPRTTIYKARASRALAAMAAVTAAAALVLGGVNVVAAIGDESGRTRAASGGGDSAPPPRRLEDVPLLLVGHAGWSVSRADQHDRVEGEMTFTNGERELDLTWRPAETHEDYVEDRAAEAAQEWDVHIARRDGKLFRYEGTTDFTAMWVDGDLSLELRGVFPDVHAFRAVADTLDRARNEEAWLAALPDETVTPDERSAVIDEMLEDIPVQPAVQVEKLKREPVINDRYQLGARVTGLAACAWIDEWVEATRSGDQARAREAVEAMGTSHSWAILQEMEPQGEWSEVLWEYATAMAGDERVNGGPGEMSIEETYEDALGCS